MLQSLLDPSDIIIHGVLSFENTPHTRSGKRLEWPFRQIFLERNFEKMLQHKSERVGVAHAIDAIDTSNS
jgi:hypothetical protein